MQMRAYAPAFTVEAAGRCWRLERPASLEELWEAMAQGAVDDDAHIPYWTELWPSSVALCSWLEARRQEIAGKICLDLGCGLGLTAMTGQMLGARVLAVDYEEEALKYARHNALLNGVEAPLWTVMDWRAPAVRAGSVAVVWGGDIMYERAFITPVLDFLEHVLAAQGRVWIAEPCRSVYDVFLAALYQRRWNGQRVFSAVVDPLYAQPVRVTVHVWELTRRR